MPEAVFRFDVSPEIGFGHAVRCAALARHLTSFGWHSVAAANQDVRGLWLDGFDRLVTVKAGGDATALGSEVGGGADLLVVDHYGWDAVSESACRGWAKKIAVIDDLADRDHDCDLLCNSSLDPLDYDPYVGAATRLLLGPRYALLRPEFAQARHRLTAKSKGRVERLFVNVGATDPRGLLPVIVDGIALAGFDGAVDIVIARNAPGRVALEQKLSRSTVKARLHVDAGDVAALMAVSDLAIGAAGGTAWERCSLYLPSLIVVAAGNQRHVAAGLAAAGAAAVIDEGFSADVLAKALSPLLMAAPTTMARRAGRLCDGLGCGRVAEAALFPSTVSLRPADDGDGEILLQWQREGGARQFARNPRVPDAVEHADWFSRKLSEPGCVFHIIEVEKTPAGFLRLDYGAAGDTYEVSIGVSERFQGKGVAAAALAIVRRLLPWADLRAFVKPDNTRSVGLFTGAGYVEHRRGADGLWFASPPWPGKAAARQPARLGLLS